MLTQNQKNPDKKTVEHIKLVLACDYPLLREGIAKIIDNHKDIQVVSKSSNLLDLVQSCEEFKFDILLLDVDLQGLHLTNILNLLKKNKKVKVILIINDNYDENKVINAIRSGVRGYLLKNSDSSGLIKAIKAVNEGELWVERKMMVKVLDAFSSPGRGRRNKGNSPVCDLTETEVKVVRLVLTGLSNKGIAQDLFLSEKTVKFHLYKIFRKLSLKNRSQLILYGFRNGFIT